MRHIFFIAALLAICSTSVAAQQIYRWVDDNGTMHFGAQPPLGVNATRIEAKASRPGSMVPLGSKPSYNAVDDPEQQALEAKVKNEVMAQEAERNKFCEQTRSNLAQLRNNPRLSYADESGKVHRLTEEERKRRTAEAEQGIKDFCL